MVAQVRLEVAYATPGQQWLTTIDVPAGTSVRDAAIIANTKLQLPGVDATRAALGIFGERFDDAAVTSRLVRAGDRIEIYRPLTLDPKELRRAKAKARRSKQT